MGYLVGGFIYVCTMMQVAPFGGVKQSGLGREGSKYGMDEYLEVRTNLKCFCSTSPILYDFLKVNSSISDIIKFYPHHFFRSSMFVWET